tara:strand:- start:244 stop:396 length:153 start_codon:yes stop_codon:yes gene_type:complete
MVALQGIFAGGQPSGLPTNICFWWDIYLLYLIIALFYILLINRTLLQEAF